MPLYEYVCEACEACDLTWRPVDLRDAPLGCYHCEGGAMKRRFNPQDAQFKFDFLREAGFFDSTARDYNADERTRPDLFRVEERRFALGGLKKGEE